MAEKVSVVKHPGARLNLPVHRWLVALDLGTAYSGIASFMTDGNLQEITVISNWEGVHQQGSKTRTCILLDEQLKFLSFGAAAEKALSQMPEARRKEVYFFKDFKMSLYKEWKDEKIPRHATITAINGRTARALTVFALSIKYMRDTFATQLQSSTGHQLEYEDVLWVITVPAIWRDDAKQFMRQAAYEAGLFRKEDPNRLILALESESAGVFCNYLLLPKKSPTVFKGRDASSDLKAISPGDKYMIIDCGGGTVDIAVHERMPNGSVREATSRSGSNAGGQNANQGFEDFLAELLTLPVLQTLKKEDPAVYLEQCNEFETGKRSVDRKEGGAYVLNVRLAAGMGDFLEENDLPSVKQLLADYSGKLRATWRKGYFKFEFSADEGFFYKPLQDIRGEVESVLRVLRDKRIQLSRVFYVGGFSECLLLQDVLNGTVRQYQPRAQILIPDECGLAVLKGAVLFGRNPEAVSERVCVHTYGIKTSPDFDCDEHDVDRRVQIKHNKSVCDGVFHHMVKAGQVIKQGQVETHTFEPQRKDAAESFVAAIYESEKHSADVLYVDDPKVKHLGTLTLKFTDPPAPDADRKVTVQFAFNQTEIHVEATECATGMKVEIDIKFMFEDPDRC